MNIVSVNVYLWDWNYNFFYFDKSTHIKTSIYIIHCVYISFIYYYVFERIFLVFDRENNVYNIMLCKLLKLCIFIVILYKL